MGLLRDYMWLWVIVVVIFVSFLISIIFVLINKCLSRGGKHRISQVYKDKSDPFSHNNKFQERNSEVIIPPLPPRTQFLTAESQSYENLAEELDCEENQTHIPEYDQDQAPVPNYDQMFPDYEQNAFDPPDYISVEDEVKVCPPPPSPPPYEDPDLDNASTEDYDDIGEENQDEEDYDDVG